MVGSKEADTNKLHDRDIETTVKEMQHIIECQKDNWVESEKSYIHIKKESVNKETDV